MEATNQQGRIWVGPLLEVTAVLVVELAYYATCAHIHTNPTERFGQVSALAAIAYRFIWFAIPLITALLVIAKHRPAWWDLAVRIACAAFAGLASAMAVGGLVCILRGTSYGLGANRGDSAVLANWALHLQQGKPEHGIYPPLQTHLLAWISDLKHLPPLYAVKPFQLFSLFLVCPLSYFAWRLVLRPPWALAIGVVGGLPLIEFFRQYPLIVLLTFLPVIIAFLETLRTSSERPARGLMLRGAGFGAVLGIQFLMYSGWFQWSAPGVFLVALLVFPWRTGWRSGVVFAGSAAIVFLALSGYTILQVLASPPIKDDFFYFDTTVDPAYIAMWKTALPGPWEHVWPPPGELGGVGVFMLVLCAGWASALALGARRTAVIATSWILVGAWLFRMHYASRMWETKMVQLYPRTTTELVYCLIALTGLAIFLYVERRRADAPETSVLRSPWATIGALTGMALVTMTAMSAIADRYMPRKDDTDFGHLAHLAHVTLPLHQSYTWHATAYASSGDPRYLVDLKPQTVFESTPSPTADHEEWIDLQLGFIDRFSRVVMTPAGPGFPVDFTIDVWNGSDWLTRITQTATPTPTGDLTLTLPQPEVTGRLRLRVTKLSQVGAQYQLRLAEIKVYP